MAFNKKNYDIYIKFKIIFQIISKIVFFLIKILLPLNHNLNLSYGLEIIRLTYNPKLKNNKFKN